MENSFHCVAELLIRDRYGAASVIPFFLQQVNYLFSCEFNHKKSGITHLLVCLPCCKAHVTSTKVCAFVNEAPYFMDLLYCECKNTNT